MHVITFVAHEMDENILLILDSKCIGNTIQFYRCLSCIHKILITSSVNQYPASQITTISNFQVIFSMATKSKPLTFLRTKARFCIHRGRTSKQASLASTRTRTCIVDSRVQQQQRTLDRQTPTDSQVSATLDRVQAVSEPRRDICLTPCCTECTPHSYRDVSTAFSIALPSNVHSAPCSDGHFQGTFFLLTQTYLPYTYKMRSKMLNCATQGNWDLEYCYCTK